MNNEEKKFNLIKFQDGDFSLDIKVSPSEDTVWLTLDEIGLLFERDKSVIGKHARKIISNMGLKDNSVKANFAHTASDGKTYYVDHYNLDMITAIGYRIKSSRTTEFKEWALNEIEQLKNQNSQKMALSQYILFNYDEIKLNVNVDPDKDTVWLNKNQLIILFDTTRQNLEYHITNIYSQNELVEEATCKKILQVQTKGNREIGR